MSWRFRETNLITHTRDYIFEAIAVMLAAVFQGHETWRLVKGVSTTALKYVSNITSVWPYFDITYSSYKSHLLK